MALVTPSDYSTIRDLLRVGADDLPDTMLVFPGAMAEKRIRLRIGNEAVDTAIGQRALEIDAAANYLTAAIVAPNLKGSSVDVTNLRVGDTSMTRASTNWTDLADALTQTAYELLDGPTLDDESMSFSYFYVVRDDGRPAPDGGRLEGT